MSGSSSDVLMTAMDQGGSYRLMHAVQWHYLCVLSLVFVSMLAVLTDAQGSIAVKIIPSGH
jgi:hypothetical protein